MVPAELAVGEGPEADPAGPRQPARHALDGPLRAGRRHPRHARRRLDRLLGLARLHPHAHPATPSGCSTTSTSARPSSSSRPDGAARCKLGGAGARRRARRRAARAARLEVVAAAAGHGREGRRARGKTGPAPTSTCRASTPAASSRSRRCAGRRSCSTSGQSWCDPCKAEAPRARARLAQYRKQGLVVVGVDVYDFASDAPQVRAQARRDLPARPRRRGQDDRVATA